jgi:hypothetical protein
VAPIAHTWAERGPVVVTFKLAGLRRVAHYSDVIVKVVAPDEHCFSRNRVHERAKTLADLSLSLSRGDCLLESSCIFAARQDAQHAISADAAKPISAGTRLSL